MFIHLSAVFVVSCLAAFAYADGPEGNDLDHCIDLELFKSKYSSQIQECHEHVTPDMAPEAVMNKVVAFNVCWSKKVDGVTKDGDLKLEKYMKTLDGIMNEESPKYKDVKEIIHGSCVPEGHKEHVTEEVACPNDVATGIAMVTGA